MLDVSIQASIVNLLLDLQKEFGFSYLFITHDLELAKIVAKRIAVMYAGQIVEESFDVLENPLHPYTKYLLGELEVRVANRSGSYKFYSYCPFRSEECLKQPELVEIGGRKVRCHLVV